MKIRHEGRTRLFEIFVWFLWGRLFDKMVSPFTTQSWLLTTLYQKPSEKKKKKKKKKKKMWEKEKMLVTSIFSFSHNVFKSPQNKFQNFSHNFILSSGNAYNFGPVYM